MAEFDRARLLLQHQGKEIKLTPKIRILIADDFKLLREVIRLYLERAEDMSVVDEAPDLDDALESAKVLQPDIIIMNGDLPPIDRAHATTLLRQHAFAGGILVISMQPEAELIHRILGSGANGFMHKDEIDEYLVDAIRHVHRGEQYFSPKAKTAYGIMPK